MAAIGCGGLALFACVAAASADEIRVKVVPAPLAPTADDDVPTLRAAFDRVQTLRRERFAGRAVPAVIELAPGWHFLDEPLRLTPADCDGTATTEVIGVDYHVTSTRQRQPFPGVRSIVSGGRPITGWRAEERDGRPAWVADVPTAKGGAWPFRELFVNGQRRTRARHPDRGYLAVAALAATDAPKEWNVGVSSFSFAPHDLDLLRAAPDADVIVMCRWIESHVRVKAIDFEKNVVELREPTVFKLDPGDPWYLDGSPAFLDAPGEWWLDEAAGRVWYLPLPGEELGRIEAIAPRLERLLSIEGESASERRVHDIAFRGVGFAHAAWWFPPAADDPLAPRAAGFPQAAFGVPAAIEVVGGHRLDFVGCAIEHVGTWGIAFGAGCSENLVGECRLRDLGAGGVKIGETAIRENPLERTGRNEVRGCEIGDGGRIFHSAIGVWIGQAPGNVLLGNEIHDFAYTGISIGWTWGYGAADAGAQHVAENEVHHIGMRSDGDPPILSDMGGIYTLGDQRGTTIEQNFFHDIAARTYGGWGIYFDEGTSNVIARRNLVARTTHGGFHQHYGKENLVENNVFAYGRDAQLQRTRCEPHTSFTFRNNVVLFDRGELFAGDLSDGHFVFEGNLYWREDGGEIRFAGRSFAQWQEAGFDRGSRIVAPGFTDPHGDQWSLVADAPARSLLPDLADLRPHAWGFETRSSGPLPSNRR